MSQEVTQERDKGAKFPETDLTFFSPFFVVCVVLLESYLQRNSTIRLSNIIKFGSGKIHVNKKLFTLDVILSTFFFIFTSSCIVSRQKVLQQCLNIGKA